MMSSKEAQKPESLSRAFSYASIGLACCFGGILAGAYLFHSNVRRLPYAKEAKLELDLVNLFFTSSILMVFLAIVFLSAPPQYYLLILGNSVCGILYWLMIALVYFLKNHYHLNPRKVKGSFQAMKKIIMQYSLKYEPNIKIVLPGVVSQIIVIGIGFTFGLFA